MRIQRDVVYYFPPNFCVTQEKFDFLLQHLNRTDIGYIRNIIQSTVIDKNTKSKQKLISIYGQSNEEKISKLLQEGGIDLNKKPSLIVDDLRRLAGTAVSDTVLRTIWLKYLSLRVCEFSSCDEENGKSLDEQARTADKLYKTFEMKKPKIVFL